jgi:ribose 1,5-bisphosphate isomerase
MLYWLLSHLYLLIGSYQYSVNPPYEEIQGPIGGQFDKPILSGVLTIMENLEQRLAMIRNDREHGSRWLVRETIKLLYDLANDTSISPNETMQRLQITAHQLIHARPAMAALAGAVNRILNVSGGPSAIAQAAQHLLDEYTHATEHIATFARPLLRSTLMTHSLSGTVLDGLIACSSQIERVIVLEGRPRYEGRETARLLTKQGIAVTLITDAEADIFLPQCHAVITGADTIFANGDILNKAGTALIAWAAFGHHIPFYVLCETLKISPYTWSGDLTQLEEKEAEEVLEQPIPNVTVRNFYFDHTPAQLVTKLITEQGILGQQEIAQIAAELKHMKL